MEVTVNQITIGYLIGINAITFVLYGFDKYSAHANLRRTPERVLWLLALIGGSIGALLAMRQFRHKTKKASFYLVIWLIIVIQVGLVYAFVNVWPASAHDAGPGETHHNAIVTGEKNPLGNYPITLQSGLSSGSNVEAANQSANEYSTGDSVIVVEVESESQSGFYIESYANASTNTLWNTTTLFTLLGVALCVAGVTVVLSKL